MKPAVVTFLVAVLLLAVTPMTASQPDSGPDSEEYAIYSLVLNELKMIGESYVVINDHTIADRKPFTSSKQRLQSANRQVRGGIPRKIRDDFETKNQVRYRLEDQFKLSVKTVFLSQAEIDKLVLPEWIDFLKNIPRMDLLNYRGSGSTPLAIEPSFMQASRAAPKPARVS